MSQLLQPVRGTADLMPEGKARHNHVIESARNAAALYGFEDMATPIFEFTEVFSRPLGASSDVVSKETYSFEDRGGAGLTLRPEGTAAVMRAILSNGLTQTLPQKLFYAGPMFRYERPQKGRMRQFHQIGAELIGPAHGLADAEIIALGARILGDLGVLDRCKLHLNTLGDDASRAAYREALVSYFRQHEGDLSADSQRRLAENPLRILDSKDAGDRAILVEAPKLPDFLNAESTAHFAHVTAALDAANIDWILDPLLVRGLDYYSHTAFEFITDALGAQGTVLGGGRYDGLAETLGGPRLPAVGFAAGVERLALLLEAPAQRAPDVLMLAADEAALPLCFELAETLRHHKVSVDLPLSGNMGKKMKRADKLGVRYVVIMGSDELANNTVQLRDMGDGSQVEIARDALPQSLIKAGE